MIHVSDAARQELLDHFRSNPPGPLRIKVAPGACTGPRLILAPDRQLTFDEAIGVDGLTFVIQRSLLSQVGEVSIDATPSGFTVGSERKADVDCSGGGDCESCAARHGHSFPR